MSDPVDELKERIDAERERDEVLSVIEALKTERTIREAHIVRIEREREGTRVELQVEKNNSDFWLQQVAALVDDAEAADAARDEALKQLQDAMRALAVARGASAEREAAARFLLANGPIMSVADEARKRWPWLEAGK